jgi:hypothetical protein
MDHRAHEPGTVADCTECQTLALEPGWYKTLRSERVTGVVPDSVLVPDAGEQPVEVLTHESPHTEVLLPELEQTRLEEAP